MNKIQSLALLLLCLFLQIIAGTAQNDLYCMFLSDDVRYIVEASRVANSNVTFTLTVQKDYPDTWLAVGLSSEENIEGADMFIAKAMNGAELFYDDYYLNEQLTPEKDTIVDYNWRVQKSVASNVTVQIVMIKVINAFEFSKDEDISVEDTFQYLIWAKGKLNDAGDINFDANDVNKYRVNFFQEHCGNNSGTPQILTLLTLIVLSVGTQLFS